MQVVLPQTLLSQWADEAKLFAPDLNVFTFEGCKRSRWEGHNSVAHFMKADVVLTTYDQLAKMARNRAGALLRVQWWRVVLDEAQVCHTRSLGILRRHVTGLCCSEGS